MLSLERGKQAARSKEMREGENFVISGFSVGPPLYVPSFFVIIHTARCGF